MQAIARAGVEFHGSAMRYAEIEQTGDDFRLLRLGDCQFEFDAYEVLFSGGPDAFLDTISEAVAEVFEGSSARVFRIVVHPPVIKSFSSSFPDESDENVVEEQIIFESALLDVERDVAGLRSTTFATLAAGGPYKRVHIAHLTADIESRLNNVFLKAGWPDLDIISSSEAAASVTGKLSEGSENSLEPILSLGIFESYSMYTVVRNGEWIYNQVRPETDPSDVAYFALHALSAADVAVSELSAVLHYGTEDLYTASGTFNSVFNVPVRVMNPIETVGLKGNAFAKDFAQTAFAVCIGAAF